MVDTNIKEQKIRAQFALLWLWVVITALVLMFFMFFTWVYQEQQQGHFSQNAAKEIRLNFDDEIDDLNRAMINIHLLEKKQPICSPAFFNQMKQFVFDHPVISGLYIADKKQRILCSTVGDIINKSPKQDSNQPMIFGPFKEEGVENAYFIIQQPGLDHDVGVYILQRVLEERMHIKDESIDNVTLFDSVQNKPLIVLNTKAPGGQLNKALLSAQKLLMLNKGDVASNKLQSLDNAVIMLHSDYQYLFMILLQKELLIAAIVIFITSLLYLQLKKLLSQRYSLTGTLRHAIKANQFFPIYQPVYDMKKKAYVGAEVLVRWHSETNEEVPPDFFIDEAEASGLIVPITQALVEKALDECEDLLKSSKDFHLAFNLSRDHFVNERFLPDFIALCERKNIHPKQIILELTERQLLDLNDKGIKTKIAILRSKGFSLALDDYGTGHASISYLQSFPFNYLKIDKIYTQSIGSGAITETLIETIIEMASKLKLTLIAEGVETPEQMSYLKQHDVHLVQGWLFAKAMSYEQLILFVESN